LSQATSDLGDWIQSGAIQAEYLLSIADRKALPAHPVLQAGYRGSVNAGQSTTLVAKTADLGGAVLPSPVAEGSLAVPTDLTDGSVTVAISRHSKAYDLTDFVRMVDAPVGPTGMRALTMDAISSTGLLMTSKIASLCDDPTTTAGPGTGNDLTVASMLAAIGALSVNNVDPSAGFLGVLHPQAYSDLIVNGGATLGAGAVAQDVATFNDLAALKAVGFAVRWLGVDFFVSSFCPTVNAGEDVASAIFGAGSILWAVGEPELVTPASQVVLRAEQGVPLLYERERSALSASTAFVQHCWLGVTYGTENAISIVSDAP